MIQFWLNKFIASDILPARNSIEITNDEKQKLYEALWENSDELQQWKRVVKKRLLRNPRLGPIKAVNFADSQNYKSLSATLKVVPTIRKFKRSFTVKKPKIQVKQEDLRDIFENASYIEEENPIESDNVSFLKSKIVPFIT